MTIKGKVAVITGASSGIGYATALALSKAGAKVAIGARRTDKLEQLENEIKKNGGEVLSHKLDVTKKDNCNDSSVMVFSSSVSTAPGSMHVTRMFERTLSS